MLEAGHRRKTQPAPPRILFEALIEPDRDPVRPWLLLLADEQRPKVLEAVEPVRVVWSSLWPRYPDARIRFDIASDGGGGTALSWTLLVTQPLPDPATRDHLCSRLNKLINGDLRQTFDQ